MRLAHTIDQQRTKVLVGLATTNVFMQCRVHAALTTLVPYAT